MGLTASLPMYTLPETRALENAWWDGLRAHFQNAGIEDIPARLHTPGSLESHWLDPDLFLSQTCGYPLTHSLRSRVSLVGTPAYRAPGCEGPLYSSAILVGERAAIDSLEDLRGGVAACNAADSHSGYNALRASIAPLAENGRFFRNLLLSGSHAGSAALVGAGKADVCAVDPVTYALLGRYAPKPLAGTRLLTWSAPAPGLPYITRIDTTPARLAQIEAGLAAAFADPLLAEVRNGLLLAGCVPLTLTDYTVITEQETMAERIGYPKLA